MSRASLNKMFNTHIPVPRGISAFFGKKASDARIFAIGVARDNLRQNRASYRDEGINNPAALLYINKGAYYFYVYDDDKETAQGAAPDGIKIIEKVEP